LLVVLEGHNQNRAPAAEIHPLARRPEWHVAALLVRAPADDDEVGVLDLGTLEHDLPARPHLDVVARLDAQAVRLAHPLLEPLARASGHPRVYVIELVVPVYVVRL